MPRFADRFPPDAPPVRKVGLFATAGLPEPEPPAPGCPPFVAIAVGKTKDGESLPANPGHCQLSEQFVFGTLFTKFRETRADVRVSQYYCISCESITYLSMTTAGVWEVIFVGCDMSRRREGCKVR